VHYAGQPLGSGDVTAQQPYPQAAYAGAQQPQQQHAHTPLMGSTRSRLHSFDCSPTQVVLPCGSTAGSMVDNSPGARLRSSTWGGGGVSPWHSPVVSPQSSYAPPPGYMPAQGASPTSAAPDQGIHLQAGSHTLKGMKPNMPDWTNQDVSVVMPLEQNRVLGAVFDGHGKHGHTCSRLACTVVMQQASSIFMPGADLVRAFHQMFRQIHAALAEQGPEIAGLSGCTGTIGVIDPGLACCHVGHVGDSTAIVVNSHGVVFASNDHRIEAGDEERINASGGEVRRCEQSGAVRVFARGQMTPGLALARSLGDLEGNSVGVLAEPEIDLNLPFEAGSAMVIASDGLWDVLPRDGVGAKARSSEPKECATTMVTDARTQWARFPHIDDITCVIVKALPREGGGGSPHLSPRIQAPVPLPVGAYGAYAPLQGAWPLSPPASPGLAPGSAWHHHRPAGGGGGSMSLSPGGQGVSAGSMSLPPGGGSMSLSPGGGSMSLSPGGAQPVGSMRTLP